MRNIRLATVAALVGAITMAPTELRSADALISARALTASTSVAAGTAGVVAGLTSGATATGALTLSAITTSSCAASTTATAKVTSSTSITVASVSGISIGNLITAATGISAGTRVTNISGTTLTLSASISVAKDSAVNFSGCFQQFFSVNNIGTIGLLSFTISQTSSSTSPTGISVQSCSGTWLEGSSSTCSLGSISTLFTNSAGASATSSYVTLSGTFPTGAQARRLRVVCDRSGQSTLINVRVSTATNLRAGVVTNG